MLDGKAYKAHFPDDPAYDVASRVEAPRMPNSVELLAALAGDWPNARWFRAQVPRNVL
jgi:hypothetical protein